MATPAQALVVDAQDQRQTESIQLLQGQLENVTQLVLNLSVRVSQLQIEVSPESHAQWTRPHAVLQCGSSGGDISQLFHQTKTTFNSIQFNCVCVALSHIHRCLGVLEQIDVK